MKKINRREFIGKNSIGLGAALVLSQIPGSIFAETIPELINQPIGFQTFPIRDMIAKDFPGLNYGASVEVRPVAPECPLALGPGDKSAAEPVRVSA